MEQSKEPKILGFVGIGDGIYDDFDLEAERKDAWDEIEPDSGDTPERQP